MAPTPYKPRVIIALVMMVLFSEDFRQVADLSRGRERAPVRSSERRQLRGLYDMVGNLDEWVKDRYRGLPVMSPSTDPVTWSGSDQGLRTARGCGYTAWSTLCRMAYQYSAAPSVKGFGFRLARTLE